MNSVRLKTKFVFEERYFSTNHLVGHLNGFFVPRGGNLSKPIFKRSLMSRGLPGGMLKLQFDWYIKMQHKSNLVS